jgi:AraC-like DNA-binding protein
MDLVRKKFEITWFDQLTDVLKGWETKPVQLSSGPLNLQAETVWNSDFTLLRLSLAPRISDQSVVHAGVMAFVLAERPQVWCGLEITPPALVMMRSGREMRSVLEPGFRSLEIYFNEDDIANHTLGCRLDSAALDPERSVFLLSEATANVLRVAVDAVFSWPTPSDFLSGVTVRNRLLDLIEDIISPQLDIVSDGRGYPQRCASTRLAQAALEEIDRFGASNASLPQLLTGLGVSRRALEKAFRSTIGVSPGQYLIAQRLNQMRRHLHNGDGQVLDSIFEAGFNDPSRAARHYRRLFGELPSHTLTRFRSNIS